MSTETPRLRVLISAYACEPERGSEPGVGWNWARAAARTHDVWVLTRANNRQAIENAVGAGTDRDPQFVYLDLPDWALSWKSGKLGVRLYYVLWQVAASRAARRLHQRHRFDLVHHVTFANLWLPALTCFAGPPFVLGPLSGGQRVPLSLYGALGVRGTLAEVVLRGLRVMSRVNPLVRVAWRRADAILVNNHETLNALPRAYRAKCRVRTNTCFEGPVSARPGQRQRRRLIYAGRLHRFKGVDLAIRAMHHLPGWQLDIVGEGSDEGRLRRIVSSEGLGARVNFATRLQQADLWKKFASSTAMVFPSLKEGGGFVAAEAQALGVPVVAFAMGGPATLADLAGARFELVRPGSHRASTRALAEAVKRLETRRFDGPLPDFSVTKLADDIDNLYTTVVASQAVEAGR
jgi:glycosyltransferase involved in cell wall biosynthesis